MSTAIPGLRYSISLYLVSDLRDAEIVVTIDSPIMLPPITDAPDPAGVLQQLGCDVAHLLEGADDWRAMSSTEISDYRERAREV